MFISMIYNLHNGFIIITSSVLNYTTKVTQSWVGKNKQCRLIIYKIDCHFIHRVLEIPNNINLIEYRYTLWWTNMAMENGHRNSGFSYEKWWFSIAMLVHQRVYILLSKKTLLMQNSLSEKKRRPFSNLTVHHFPTKEKSCDKLCFFSIAAATGAFFVVPFPLAELHLALRPQHLKPW